MKKTDGPVGYFAGRDIVLLAGDGRGDQGHNVNQALSPYRIESRRS